MEIDARVAEGGRDFAGAVAGDADCFTPDESGGRIMGAIAPHPRTN
jgi:hypothetical protein